MDRHHRSVQQPDLMIEFDLLHNGCTRIAGVDEAGRGAWAGPVVAAAVVLPVDRFDLARSLEGVRDSKKMTSPQREFWADHIHAIALGIGIGVCSSKEVDKLGLMPATRKAMARAVAELDNPPDHLLIDHILLPDVPLPQTKITRGDTKVLSIAAASVIAKVSRDQAMVTLENRYPGYGFARHKGYGTSQHRIALEHLGPCPIHRRSYAPVAGVISLTTI